ncbi:transmembrane 9 superfamily member 12-like isoform X2 [Rhodamnia argentea]|nr:transmembrane 9 superfamily member 12-like isoform X2 [Rhodamnia argentea]XP_048141903.1 transmembrane 9 superfamily member 12-like isoform X2 [Rhodamnia argentea]
MTSSAIRSWVFFALSSIWFSLARSYMHTYVSNDHMSAQVNSLTSIETLLPLSYYGLPYCKPMEGIRKRVGNVGAALMGDQIVNSPYRFRGHVNESIYLCTTSPLSKQEARLLKQRIRDMYQVNMMLDGLPVIRYVSYGGIDIQWTGFPIGYPLPDSDDVYIINHLKFTILVNEHSDCGQRGCDIMDFDASSNGMISEGYKATSPFEIVGFRVVPCSVKYDPENMQRLKMYDNIDPIECPLDLETSQVVREDERISFTYEVQFVKSDIGWQSRWDIYLKQGDSSVRWFSVLNSLITILVLTGIVFAIFHKTISRELAKCRGLDKQAEAQTDDEPSGWKLLAGDAFKEPNHSRLLSVMVGTGVQIALTGFVTVIIAAFGFVPPDARGMILTLIITIYSCLGIVGGYIGVRLWRTLKGSTDGWKLVSWLIVFLFPGIIFIVLVSLNFVMWNNRSTAFIFSSMYVRSLLLLFCISAPVTLLGGLLATWAEAIQYPVKTNHIPREIPARTLLSWLLVLDAGMIPFGTLFIELFFLLSSICLGRFYSVTGTLCLCLLSLIILCAETSLIITYRNLQAEDWKWWWKSFCASGSASIFVFMYSIYYLVFDLKGLSGTPSVTVYVGYSLIAAIASLLSTGSIGFLASFYFVNALFSSTEI